MAQTPSRTPQEAEAILGPRGNLYVTSENKGEVRKWATAMGLPGVYVATLAAWKLRNLYNLANDAEYGLDWHKRNAEKEGIKDDGAESSEDSSPESTTIPQAPTSTAPIMPINAGDTNEAILALRKLLGGACDETMVRAIVDRKWQELPALIASYSPVTRIEIKRADDSVHTVEGITHPQFKTLLAMATARNSDGFVPGIMIQGEASSGKTHGNKQLAKALGLTWHFNGAISFPHEMLGFIDGAGHYHRTPFREAYEHGGVYTFDEVDRSDPVALLAVNPHLANGLATFPDGQITRHADCIIIATANTWGLGANADYAGATKLDGAFLSRFPRRLSWDIDETMERALSGNEKWALRVQRARDRARKAELKVMIDTRMTYAGASLIANGMSEDDTARVTVGQCLKGQWLIQQAPINPRA